VRSIGERLWFKLPVFLLLFCSSVLSFISIRFLPRRKKRKTDFGGHGSYVPAGLLSVPEDLGVVFGNWLYQISNICLIHSCSRNAGRRDVLLPIYFVFPYSQESQAGLFWSCPRLQTCDKQHQGYPRISTSLPLNPPQSPSHKGKQRPSVPPSKRNETIPTNKKNLNTSKSSWHFVTLSNLK